MRPVRMYFAGYLHPGEDDDLIAWFQSLPKGRRFATLLARLRDGGPLTLAAEQDEAKAQDAAEDILSNFVV